jgi:hypothetical protein
VIAFLELAISVAELGVVGRLPDRGLEDLARGHRIAGVFELVGPVEGLARREHRGK